MWTNLNFKGVWETRERLDICKILMRSVIWFRRYIRRWTDIHTYFHQTNFIEHGSNIKSKSIRNTKSDFLMMTILLLFIFLSVNFFRCTMHSKSPVVNLAEQHETLLWTSEQEYATINCYWYLRSCTLSCVNYSLRLFTNYKWSYHFIITQVLFQHFFSVGIGNELQWVCYNFNYPIQQRWPKMIRAAVRSYYATRNVNPSIPSRPP